MKKKRFSEKRILAVLKEAEAGTKLLVLCLALFHVLSVAADTIEGKVIRVADGDTLTIRTTQPLDYRIRISGIDAPEKGQPYGNRSKQSLAQADCYKVDRYQRKVCRVSVEGRDVGLEQVRVGAAWWYRLYAKEQTVVERREYEGAEDQAKAASVLWHISSAPPGPSPSPPPALPLPTAWESVGIAVQQYKMINW